MMPDSAGHVRHRVLLGLGDADEPRPVIETAVRLAKRFEAPVECLLLTHQDVLAAARLPFAHAVAAGGLTTRLSESLLEAHARRRARLVEQHLLALCRSASLSWRLEQSQDTLRAGLAAASSQGDLVVIGSHDLRSAVGNGPGLLRDLLSRAAAVVVPGRQMLAKRRSCPFAGYGELPELAHLLAAALGAEAMASTFRSAALVAARLDDLEREGEARFLRLLERSGAGALILPPSSVNPEPR